MKVIEDLRYTFAQDGDGHWYMIPEELEGRYYLLSESDEDTFYDEFDKYRVDGGIEGITFTNPRGLD